MVFIPGGAEETGQSSCVASVRPNRETGLRPGWRQKGYRTLSGQRASAWTGQPAAPAGEGCRCSGGFEEGVGAQVRHAPSSPGPPGHADTMSLRPTSAAQDPLDLVHGCAEYPG